MFRLFKVGETAYFRYLKHFPELNGMEVRIVGGLKFRSHFDSLLGRKVRGVRYQVEIIDRPYGNMDFYVRHKYLTRKKKPEPVIERNTSVSWDDCAWKPTEKLKERPVETV